MDEKRMNEIRKFFWNYKYQEGYDHAIYEMVMDLISLIDKKQTLTSSD